MACAKRNAHLGEMYDVFWSITEISRAFYEERTKRYRYRYVLTNTANGMAISISEVQLKRLRSGESTVSGIIYRRIRKEKKNGKIHR